MAVVRNIKPFAMFMNTQGVDQYSGTYFIKPTAADYIQNMNVDTLGQWSAYQQGYSNLSAQLESGATVDSMYVFTDSSLVDHLLVAMNGKLKNLNPSSGASVGDITYAYTAGHKVDFCAFNNNCYVASQDVTPMKWTGSGALGSIAAWPITNGGETYDKPKFIQKYYNRLVYANMNGATAYPSHIAISDDLNPESFTLTQNAATNGAVIKVNPGDNDAITGMKTFYIPFNNTYILIIFKKSSLFYLSGNTSTTYVLTPLCNGVGALNHRCIVQLGQDVIFLDQNNIYTFTGATSSGTVQPKAIGSEQVKKTLANMNLSATDAAWAIHMPYRQEVWFGIPTGSSTVPDTIIQYYYRNTLPPSVSTGIPLPPISAWSIRTNATETAAIMYGRTFLTGDTAGYINKWFGTGQYAGTGIPYIYRYPYVDFSNVYVNKRILELFAWFIIVEDTPVTFEMQWRGGGNNTTTTYSTNLMSTNSAAQYGTVSPPAGIYGTNVYGPNSVLTKVKVPCRGTGEMVQLSISGTTPANGPIFLGFSGLVEYLGPSRSYR